MLVQCEHITMLMQGEQTTPKDAFGGEQGKGVTQIKAQAAAEFGQRADACAITTCNPLSYDAAHQLQILHSTAQFDLLNMLCTNKKLELC